MFEIRGQRIQQDEGRSILDLAYSGITDAELSDLKVQRIHSLRLTGNIHITDAGMVYISEMKELVELVLERTRVGDEGLKPLKALRSLDTLDLAFTPITDAGLVHLSEMRRLRSLDVTGWNVTPAGMQHVHALLSTVPARQRAKSPNPPADLTYADLEGDGLVELSVCAEPNDDWMKSLLQFGTLGSLNIVFDKMVPTSLTDSWDIQLRKEIPAVKVVCRETLRIPLPKLL